MTEDTLYDVYLYKWTLFATRVDYGTVQAMRVEFPGLLAMEHIGEEFVWSGR